MTIHRFILVTLICFVATTLPLTAAPVKIGLYRGSVAVTQTMPESGAVMKRSFSVSGRIRDNGTFVFISAPIGIANTQLDGRFFTGTINLTTALINFINGNDVDGSLISQNNLQGTYTGNVLKVSSEITTNLGGVLGNTTVKRVFTLKRVAP